MSAPDQSTSAPGPSRPQSQATAAPALSLAHGPTLAPTGTKKRKSKFAMLLESTPKEVLKRMADRAHAESETKPCTRCEADKNNMPPGVSYKEYNMYNMRMLERHNEDVHEVLKNKFKADPSISTVSTQTRNNITGKFDCPFRGCRASFKDFAKLVGHWGSENGCNSPERKRTKRTSAVRDADAGSPEPAFKRQKVGTDTGSKGKDKATDPSTPAPRRVLKDVQRSPAVGADKDDEDTGIVDVDDVGDGDNVGRDGD